MPKWEKLALSAEFERLTAAIAAELEPGAIVTWDDHIMGRNSRRNRQIDVSIRRSDPDYLGIIDAKHYARRATIDRIDALVGLTQDVGANYGALVCSSGFSKTILDYARNVGVSLFNVHDAQSINWSRELSIPIYWTELTPNVTVVGTVRLEKGDSLDTADPLGLRVTPDGGNTVLDPYTTFESYWNGQTQTAHWDVNIGECMMARSKRSSKTLPVCLRFGPCSHTASSTSLRPRHGSDGFSRPSAGDWLITLMARRSSRRTSRAIRYRCNGMHRGSGSPTRPNLDRRHAEPSSRPWLPS